MARIKYYDSASDSWKYADTNITGTEYVLPVGGDELGGVKNGGNVVINEDGTMTSPEFAVTDEQVSSAVADYLTENPFDGSGWSVNAKTLLVTILRNGVYSTDQNNNITALETELGVTEGDVPDTPVEPDAVTYTITNNLTNVTTNNSSVSITEDASYSATLTEDDGYELDTVTVTMGGTDVTATVYADGVVTIGAVSGDVVITATAVAVSAGEPINMTEVLYNCPTVYSDGGESVVVEGEYAYLLVSEDTFTEDTELEVTITNNAVIYPDVYGTCVPTEANSPCTYATKMWAGGPYGNLASAGTYTKTYTVKAGYRFCLAFTKTQGVPGLTSVTVTK